jgi:hypothetical protein
MHDKYSISRICQRLAYQHMSGIFIPQKFDQKYLLKNQKSLRMSKGSRVTENRNHQQIMVINLLK